MEYASYVGWDVYSCTPDSRERKDRPALDLHASTLVVISRNGEGRG